MKQSKNQLGKEHSIEISPDSKKGYDKQNKGNTDTNTDTAVEQAEAGLSKTVQNAGERCV